MTDITKSFTNSKKDQGQNKPNKLLKVLQRVFQAPNRKKTKKKKLPFGRTYTKVTFWTMLGKILPQPLRRSSLQVHLAPELMSSKTFYVKNDFWTTELILEKMGTYLQITREKLSKIRNEKRCTFTILNQKTLIN